MGTTGLDAEAGLAQEEKLGKEVIRTQWLDHSTLGNQPLLGRKILIVVSLTSTVPCKTAQRFAQDEVDDSRT